MLARKLTPFLLVGASGLAWGSGGDCSLGPASVSFASEKEARAILGTEDGFIRALSSFDRAARLKSAKPVDSATFLRSVAAQALPWTDEEVQSTRTRVCEVAQRLKAKKWKLGLPHAVTLVKAVADAEAGAPHTRGAAIVLPGGAAQVTPKLLAHELFHVLSRELGRAHPSQRDALYQLVGFVPLGAPLTIPALYKERVITNPDSYELSHFVKVSAGGREVTAVPFLFAPSSSTSPSSCSSSGGTGRVGLPKKTQPSFSSPPRPAT